MALADTPEVRRLVLDLFTDVAVLEHLIRTRLRSPDERLTPQHFGLINHFVRHGKAEENLTNLAWSFQVSDEHMLAAIEQAGAMEHVETERRDGDLWVRILPAGHERHESEIDLVAPEITEIMSEFSLDDLRTTMRTLMELRWTFENLPDR